MRLALFHPSDVSSIPSEIQVWRLINTLWTMKRELIGIVECRGLSLSLSLLLCDLVILSVWRDELSKKVSSEGSSLLLKDWFCSSEATTVLFPSSDEVDWRFKWRKLIAPKGTFCSFLMVDPWSDDVWSDGSDVDGLSTAMVVAIRKCDSRESG